MLALGPVNDPGLVIHYRVTIRKQMYLSGKPSADELPIAIYEKYRKEINIIEWRENV